jgi:hypothetical protein
MRLRQCHQILPGLVGTAPLLSPAFEVSSQGPKCLPSPVNASRSGTSPDERN